MVERTAYIPFALADVMAGRIPKAAAAGLASPLQEFTVPPDPGKECAPRPAEKAPASPSPAQLPAPVTLGPSGRPLIDTASLRQPDRSGERLPPLASSDLSYNDYQDPTPLVVAELGRLGVDAAALKFERFDDVVRNWGGAYTNRLLRVDAGGGRIEDYSIDLALRSPRVTAVEIIRQMGLPIRT
jgi:hypothetical protein